jgi:hypothetical protein
MGRVVVEQGLGLIPEEYLSVWRMYVGKYNGVLVQKK